MREGRFVRIPECPSDVRRLWEEAEPLDLGALPDWLDAEDAVDYRFIGSAPRPGQVDSDPRALVAELDELESAGLIVDPDASEPGPHRIYISAPRNEPIWSIGIYEGDSPLALTPSPRIRNPVLTANDVTDVPAIFVADPFVIRSLPTSDALAASKGAPPRHSQSGVAAWHMFFEVMNWQNRKGEIGWATSSDGYRWKYRQIVLAEEFHLSYPYVFAANGEFYLAPESHEAQAVRLYRAEQFPTRWTLAATLLEGAYFADASIVRFEGRWWMFVESSSPHGHDTLRLYFSNDLLSGWCEHPASPIISGDPRAARPAGRVLATSNQLIRFAQNCADAYGLEVRAFEIAQLTPTAYTEREVAHNPILSGSGMGWNAGGMHHLDPTQLADGHWWACVDGWSDLVTDCGASEDL